MSGRVRLTKLVVPSIGLSYSVWSTGETHSTIHVGVSVISSPWYVSSPMLRRESAGPLDVARSQPVIRVRGHDLLCDERLDRFVHLGDELATYQQVSK